MAEVCRLTRQRIVRGKQSRETAYAITSLSADHAGAADLLALSRQHWAIDYRLHYVRDVTYGEDMRAPTRAMHHRHPRPCAISR